MAELTSTALELVRLYGPFALCVFTFLETSMLFPFLPSEVVVPAAAAVLVTDPVSLVVFVVAATVGGTVGALVPFAVFDRTWVAGADRLAEYLSVSDERIERGRRWFRTRGESSVLWGRFLPVLRSVVSIPAGIAGMDPIRFTVFTAVGTAGFYTAAGAVVWYGRQQSVFEALFAAARSNPWLAALVVLALGGAGLLARRWSAGRP